MSRLITVAADSMEPTLLYQWASDGKLPNLASEMEDGAYGTAACSSVSSVVQWNTYFTGVEPSRHDVTSWTKTGTHPRNTDNLLEKLVNTQNIGLKTHPELLAESGASVGLLNPIPFWPPLQLEDGVCVSGMLTPPTADVWASPESLQEELEQRGYKIDIRYGNRPYGFVDDDLMGEVPLQQLHNDAMEVLDRRIDATKYLLTEYDFEYFYGLYKTIDLVHHFFWAQMEEDAEYGDTIKRAYRRIDNLVGWLRAEYPETNILVCSDHGAQSRTIDTFQKPYDILDRITRATPGKPAVLPRGLRRVTAKLQGERPMTVREFDDHPRIQGRHDDRASWILSGKDVTQSDKSEVAFEDFTPTVLSLLDHPIPQEYIGDPIESVPPTERAQIDLSINRRETVTEEVSDRLHNLGYADMVDN